MSNFSPLVKTTINYGFYVFLLSFLITVSFSELNAQAKTKKVKTSPLKLSLRIDEKELCVGKQITIFARLENVSQKSIIIDNRNLWRNIYFRADAIPVEYAENKLFSELLSFPTFGAIYSDGFEDDDVPTEYLVTLKPKEYFEETHPNLISSEFFEKANKYSVNSSYIQAADWSAKGVKLFRGIVESNELNFELLNCK